MATFAKTVRNMVTVQGITVQEALSSNSRSEIVGDLILIYSDTDPEINGHIFENETGKLLCRGNDAARKVMWASVSDSQLEGTIVPTLDGTIVRLWQYKGNWHVSTRRKLDAHTAYWTASKDGEKLSFGDLFWECGGAELVKNLDPDYTYSVVIIHPKNRNVIRHHGKELKLVSKRHLETEQETLLEDVLNATQVREWLNGEKQFNKNYRGFIVHNEKELVQVDHYEFEEAEKLRQTARTVDRAFVWTLVNKPSDVPKFLKYFWPDRKYLERIKTTYESLQKHMEFLNRKDGITKTMPLDHVLYPLWECGEMTDVEILYRAIRKLIA